MECNLIWLAGNICDILWLWGKEEKVDNVVHILSPQSNCCKPYNNCMFRSCNPVPHAASNPA
jgi:hypothetical protein